MSGERIFPAQPGSDELARQAEAQILSSRGWISPLYRILLHSPSVAIGWEALLTAIRQKSSLDPALREIVILRVAFLNKARYEFEAHIKFALEAGLAPAQLEALRTLQPTGFDSAQDLVIAYCDAMTCAVAVPDAVFERVRVTFEPPALVELTATIAAYNMVSRLLVALDVH